jgi:hypothetical protein
MSSGISGVMSALKAESLLADSQLFDQIKSLCANLQYSTEDGKFAFDDYFKTLVDAIDVIPKLELENDVAPGTETTYTIQLTQAAETIVDECDRIFRRLNQFEGKLKEAERKIDNQKAEFVAWYMLAGNALLKDLDDLKLPQTEIRKLGEAEFSRLMGGLDTAIESLIEAVKIETSKVSQHKAAQKEKYNLGKDQANASWTSTLPAFNSAIAERNENLSGVQELDDEDVPAPVKKRSMIADTLRIIKPDDDDVINPTLNGDCNLTEIKGTFVKTGDPKPVTPVVSDAPKPPPRKRLVFDDEEI